MSIILCMDTATKACSVSLLSEEEVLTERNLIAEGYVHAEKLHVLIDEVLKEVGLTPRELSAVAVGKGPGSYTGLRIGVSAAKGLAYGADIPLISIPTLQMMSAMALESTSNSKGVLRPMLDARRMEVYSAAYDLELKEVDACKALLLEEEPFEEELDKGPVYFFGDGMAKSRELLSAHSNARFIEEVYPKSSAAKSLVFAKFSIEEFEDVAYFEPFYLKEFVAKMPKKML
jgi:tRNA threonylcarbamoyladenosine biosynthesis protein TsaB